MEKQMNVQFSIEDEPIIAFMWAYFAQQFQEFWEQREERDQFFRDLREAYKDDDDYHSAMVDYLRARVSVARLTKPYEQWNNELWKIWFDIHDVMKVRNANKEVLEDLLDEVNYLLIPKLCMKYAENKKAKRDGNKES